MYGNSTDIFLQITMATMEEHPERYGWWINELEELGLSVKKINELNDLNGDSLP